MERMKSQNGISQSYNSNNSQHEVTIKKLEYQNRQSQQDMQTYQQALNEEALKRAESDKKIEYASVEKLDLVDDVKHLTQQLEEKEDEIMLAY